MNDEAMTKAMALIEEGEYEEALVWLLQSEEVSRDEQHPLVRACKARIASQYVYLMEQAVQEKQFGELDGLYRQFKEKYGDNEQVEEVYNDYAEGIGRQEVISPFQMVNDEPVKKIAKGIDWLKENVSSHLIPLIDNWKRKG